MSHCRNILFSKDPFVFVFLVIHLLTYLVVFSVLVLLYFLPKMFVSLSHINIKYSFFYAQPFIIQHKCFEYFLHYVDFWFKKTLHNYGGINYSKSKTILFRFILFCPFLPNYFLLIYYCYIFWVLVSISTRWWWGSPHVAKQFLNTRWTSYNSIQLFRYGPEASIRSYKVRPQSHRLSLSHFWHPLDSCLPLVLRTNQLYSLGIPVTPLWPQFI